MGRTVAGQKHFHLLLPLTPVPLGKRIWLIYHSFSQYFKNISAMLRLWFPQKGSEDKIPEVDTEIKPPVCVRNSEITRSHQETQENRPAGSDLGKRNKEGNGEEKILVLSMPEVPLLGVFPPPVVICVASAENNFTAGNKCLHFCTLLMI